jgi:hypothetical protein
MRYSGEGTQENPYIPEDFTGFLHCIAQTDSYVKLESDIDAAADSGYEGILYEPVMFNCKKCYADSLKKIIGVTVNAANAIDIPSGTSENSKIIQNIGFFNWSHKQSSSSSASLIRIGIYVAMLGCPVSAQSVGSTKSIFSAYSSGQITIFRCSFHVKFSGANIGAVVNGSGLSTTCCNFILDGAAINLSSNWFFYSDGPTFSQVGIVVKNSVLTSGDSSANIVVFGNSSSNGFNYCVFENNCTGSLSADVSLKTTSDGRQGLTLFCTNGIEHLSVLESTSCKSITEAQLKDAAYLAEIGFFP